MDGNTIEFVNVVRVYKTGSVLTRALDGASFTLDKGALSIIVGPSGAGKSTVLNILGGMDVASGGEVNVFGQRIHTFTPRQRASYRRNDVGFVFQFYNLIGNLTALENVELATYVRKSGQKPGSVLGDVGLAERVNNFPSQLSGGEQQRVAIARALAKDPKLLLCDEPTGALDYETGKSVLKILQDMCRHKNVTVVLITHNQSITPMADRVVKIASGKVRQVTDNPNPVPVEEIEW